MDGACEVVFTLVRQLPFIHPCTTRAPPVNPPSTPMIGSTITRITSTFVLTGGDELVVYTYIDELAGRIINVYC